MKGSISNLINVGILSYNRPIFLRYAILSLEKAGLTKNEIFVFDNGSNINLMEDLKLEFKDRVHWVASEENLGYANNFARVFSVCNAKYLMALHDDDIVLNETFEVQLSILEGNSHIDILSCNGYKVDKNNIVSNIEILETADKNDLVIFENSSDFASHIFDNSCAPFSPTIFRTMTVKSHALKMINYEQKFGQCLDAGFLHDMSDKVNVALNMTPLYGCRVHEGQDSSIIDKTFVNVMNTEFYNNSKGSETQIKNLKKKIRTTYTVNFLLEQMKNLLSFKLSNYAYTNKSALKELFTIFIFNKLAKRILKIINA